MWVLDLSNHTERHRLSICCSEKHQSNFTFVFHLFRSGYFLLLFLRYINTIEKFCIKQAQLITLVNTRWRYFILPVFIPESRIQIVGDLLILCFALISSFLVFIHANDINYLKNIKYLPRLRLETILPANYFVKLQHLLFHVHQFQTKLILHIYPLPCPQKPNKNVLHIWEG